MEHLGACRRERPHLIDANCGIAKPCEPSFDKRLRAPEATDDPGNFNASL